MRFKLWCRKAISELPPTSREVFILSRMKNLPNKEIALRLDISVKTVEFHITRSLKQFAGAAEGLSVSLEFFIKQDHASVIWTWSCSYFIYRNQKL